MKARIATWNLERPKSRDLEKMEVQQSQLQAIDADVWIVTEGHVDATPGPEFECVATSEIEGDCAFTPGEYRTAIWSRLPVLKKVETHDPETAVCVEIEWGDRRALIYGTVFPYHAAGAPHAYRSQGADQVGRRAWELHYDSIKSHCEDWSRLRSQFPDRLLIVGGDFNQSRDGRRWAFGRQWYGTIEGRRMLTDALESTSLVCVTEEDLVASGKLADRSTIDHICLDRSYVENVQAVGAWEPETYGARQKPTSDHNGVFVDLVG